MSGGPKPKLSPLQDLMNMALQVILSHSLRLWRFLLNALNIVPDKEVEYRRVHQAHAYKLTTT